MSVPRFSVEEVSPRGYKYSLATRILDEVAPRLLSINNPLTSRVASAYSWFVYLRENAPTLCDDVCGADFEQDYKKWGEEELEKIAAALARHAARLLREALKAPDEGKPLRPPRPP